MPALGVDVPPVEDGPLDLVGVGLTGAAVAGGGLVVTEGATALELEEVLGVRAAPVLPTDGL